MKIHSCHLHAPFRGRFAPNSLNVAHYAALIRDKSPTKCDVHLTESNFQTRPNVHSSGNTVTGVFAGGYGYVESMKTITMD